jgi:Type II CAAX prenyl endopeptidase Rce1-like
LSVGAGGRVPLAVLSVGFSTVALFILPPRYFVPGTFAATGVMILSTLLVGGYPRSLKPTPAAVGIGLASAAVLYAVFYGGNQVVGELGALGIGKPNEASIYSLIASPAVPPALRVGALLFDAVGYESFFRGFLLERLRPKLGARAPPAVALFDAALHLATFNLLWVATTFVADLGWGLTYLRAGLPGSLTSHFAWDVAIFLVWPIV